MNDRCNCASCAGARAWKAAGVSGACYNGWHDQCGGRNCNCTCGHSTPPTEYVPLNKLIYPKDQVDDA